MATSSPMDFLPRTKLRYRLHYYYFYSPQDIESHLKTIKTANTKLYTQVLNLNIKTQKLSVIGVFQVFFASRQTSLALWDIARNRTPKKVIYKKSIKCINHNQEKRDQLLKRWHLTRMFFNIFLLKLLLN